MVQDEDTLGGRLPLLDPAALPASQQALYRKLNDQLISWARRNGFRGETDDGRLIGPFNPYLYSTGITPGFLAWMKADGDHTSLGKKVHEIVILTVGAVWRSPFELYAHSAVARTVGVPEPVIDGLVAGGTPDELAPEELVAHRFAHQLVCERRVDEALYREAEAAFGRVGLVDLTYLIGMYLLTCAQLNAFEIPAPNSNA